MKITLKNRLMAAFLVFCLVSVLGLFVLTRHIVDAEFANYVSENQQKDMRLFAGRAADFVDENGAVKDAGGLLSLGAEALEKGYLLKILNPQGEEVFCMHCQDEAHCAQTLQAFAQRGCALCSRENTAYLTKQTPIQKSGKTVAEISLGYYGPLVYTQADETFAAALNRGFALSFLLVGALGIMIAVYTSAKIAKPINEIARHAQLLENGHYENALCVSSGTREILDLSQSVNHLCKTLSAQRALRRRLASDYAHELRTPLATLQANLEAMIDGVWEPTRARLDGCKEEVVRLTRLIGDLSDLVNAEDAQSALRREKFDLSDLVGQLFTACQPEARKKGVSLSLDKKPCPVFADADKIKQALINLINNAIKYTKPGGRVHMRVYVHKKTAYFEIADTGIGIRERDIPYVFEHLYRTDESRAEDTGGRGIGLSIVRAVAWAHDGCVCVKSACAQGSTFTLSFPTQA